MASGKVLLIIASEGYQPIEYGIPKKILEEAGFHVVTGSNKKVPALAKDGSSTEVDIALSSIRVEHYNGIFFIGGPGALECLDTPESYRIIQDAVRAAMPLGAICVSPRILAHAGALKHKHATGWNGDGQLKKIFNQHEVLFLGQPVVVDEHIITASGPEAAQEFGSQIVALLQDNKGWG